MPVHSHICQFPFDLDRSAVPLEWHAISSYDYVLLNSEASVLLWDIACWTFALASYCLRHTRMSCDATDALPDTVCPYHCPATSAVYLPLVQPLFTALPARHTAALRAYSAGGYRDANVLLLL